MATAAARFKGLQQGWQAYSNSGPPAVESEMRSDVAGGGSECCEAECGQGAEVYWLLPSTVANYVQLDVVELCVPAASVLATSSLHEGTLPSQRMPARASSWTKVTQRTQVLSSGLLQQARGFGGNLAAAAARGRPVSAAETPRSARSTTSSNGDDIFAIGSDDDVFSDEADSPTHLDSPDTSVSVEQNEADPSTSSHPGETIHG